jgi:hypothetical protein
MDMTKYSATEFVGFDDIRDHGARQETIVGVAKGNYERPVLEFASGDKFSLNKTNVRTLIRAYGPNDRDWIGLVIELYAGETLYQGQKKDSVLVRPVSPDLPSEKRTPLPESEEADFEITEEVPF